MRRGATKRAVSATETEREIMDLVRNEERAAAPSERVGARQKHRRGYRAPSPRTAPHRARGTGLV